MIRTATVDDAPAVAALEKALFGDEAWTLEQVQEELTGPGRAGMVSTTSTGGGVGEASTSSTGGGGRDIDGYVITMTIGDLTDLQRVGVHPDSQRQGLAGRLLDAVLVDVDRMLLEVAEDNEAALAFYRRRGFVEIDRRPRYYRSGAAAVVMELVVK